MTKKDTGIVNIHGKEYQTVAYRVGKFRDEYKLWSIITEIISTDDKYVIVKASILNDEGRIIATGHGEELRGSSQINKTSALENCETSAIGRALASFGMGGTEFASADEVANAIYQQSNENSYEKPWYNDFEKEKEAMIADIERGAVTAEEVLSQIKRYYKVSSKVQNLILELQGNKLYE